MKKTILITLTAVWASLFLFAGVSFAQYGYEDDVDAYDNYEYSDYEYRLDNCANHLDRYRGPVYYFHHQQADVYFVLVGNMTFVVPAYTFRRYLPRHNFVWVPQTRFISLSCGGLDYYDNYLRFNFYSDFYHRHRWDRRYHTQVRRDFRKYYTGRHHNRWYQKNRRQIMAQRERTVRHSRNSQHRYSANEGRRTENYNRYRHQSDSHRKLTTYSKSPGKSYSNRSGYSKLPVKSRNYKTSKRTYSHHDRTKRRSR